MGFFKSFTKAISNPVTLLSAAASVAMIYGTGGAILGLTALQGFGVMAVATAALSAASQALAPKPDVPTYQAFSSGALQRTQNLKQPVQPRNVIYGQIRQGGTIGFIESTDDDKFLHMVILVASHEIEEYTTIYLNDEALTLSGNDTTSPDQYDNKVKVYTQLGTTTQTAHTALIADSSKWTADHRLRGIANVYMRFEFDRDAFPRGIPNVSALVKGKKLYDPRTTNTAYSANPALAIRDYLTNSTYGFGADASEIDDASFIAAANICDESVALAGGGTQNRYEIHGSFNTSQSPKQVLEQLLTSCGGTIFFSNGKFHLKVAKYTAPTITLTEDDLRGAISLQTRRSRRDNYNAVKGVFAPAATNYIPADYPSYTSSTFVTEDGGDTVFLDYDLPYTTDAAMAQRLAKIALFRNRQQITMTMPCTISAFKLAVGDTVMVTNDRLGFTSKVFEVSEWKLAVDVGANDQPVIGVDLTLRELNSQVFDWDADEQAFITDNTNLPNPYTLSLPEVVTDEGVVTINQQPVATIEVAASSTNPQVIQFYAEYKESTETDYITLGYSDNGFFTIPNVKTEVIYDIRVRSYGANSRSLFRNVQHTVTGKTAYPSDVTNFSVNIVGENAQLSWTPVTDADLSHYVIRHTPDTETPSYPNTTIMAEKVARPANTVTVPAVTGTYFIKAVDKFGNRSVNAAQQGARVDDIGQYNLVETSTQHSAFAGNKTNCAVTDDQLVLDTDANFDSAAGLFDDATGFFDGGGTGIDQQQTGTYEFDNIIDLTAVYTSRVTSRVITSRIDFEDLFDTATGNFDDRAGLFDGDPLTFGDTNVELQVSTTDGDPAGTPTWSSYQRFVSGTYKARAFRFRAILSTTNPASTPAVSELSVTVDMPDLVSADNDIASGAGAKVITFVPPFRVLKGIGIAAGNLQSGDYYAITSKSATGFTITFYDSSDTAVDRTFDYVARGY